MSQCTVELLRRIKKLALGLLLALAIPTLGSGCGPGLGWEGDLGVERGI